MLWRILACLLTCLVPIGVSADHCVNGICVQQVQHVQTVQHVVTPAVVTVFQPVTVAVPVYGVGYGGDNASLINELKLLRQEMQQLRLNQTERKEALQVHPGLQVLQNRCASCHDDASAKIKGNSIQFFAGLNLLSEGDIPSKILEQVHNDNMPKGKEKLTDKEKYDVLRFFTVKEVKK